MKEIVDTRKEKKELGSEGFQDKDLGEIYELTDSAPGE